MIVRVTRVDDRLHYQILYMVEDGAHVVITLGRDGEKYMDDFTVLPDLNTDERLPVPPNTCFTEIMGHVGTMPSPRKSCAAIASVCLLHPLCERRVRP